MKLNLKVPLCFFDLETTGTNTAQDRIIEIAVIRCNTPYLISFVSLVSSFYLISIKYILIGIHNFLL